MRRTSDRYNRRRPQLLIGRRRVLRAASSAGLAFGVLALVGCESDSNEEVAGSGAEPVATATGAQPTGTQSESVIPEGGTFNWTYSNEPPNFNFYLNRNASGKTYASHIYSRLYKFKADPDSPAHYEPDPDVVLTVERPTATEYFFTLRDDVTFHDIHPVSGRRLTAEDVAQSFNYYLSEGFTRAQLAPIVTDVSAVDESVVSVRLSQPYSPLIGVLASPQHLWIFPEEVFSGGIDPSIAEEGHQIGSGPFIFKDYRQGSALTFARNEQWHHPVPHVEGVDLLVVPDASTRFAQLQSGNIHVAGLSAIDRQLLTTSNNKDITTLSYRRPTFPALYFQPLSDKVGSQEFFDPTSPLLDVRVRRAVSMAIDRDAYIQLAYGGEGYWNSRMPVGLEGWGLDPQGDGLGDAKQWYQFDPDRARQLLAEAGYADGFRVELHNTEIIHARSHAEFIANSLGKIGVQTDIVTEDITVYASATSLGRFKGMALTTLAPFTEPDEFAHALLHSEGSRNWSNYYDEELDAMVDESRRAESIEERQAIIHRADVHASNAMNIVPLPASLAYVGVRSNVVNYRHVDGVSYASDTIPLLGLG